MGLPVTTISSTERPVTYSCGCRFWAWANGDWMNIPCGAENCLTLWGTDPPWEAADAIVSGLRAIDSWEPETIPAPAPVAQSEKPPPPPPPTWGWPVVGPVVVPEKKRERIPTGKRCYRCFKDSGLCTEHDQPPTYE